MDYRATYKDRGINVYPDAHYQGAGPSNWLFDIYDRRDNRLLQGRDITDSEPAALAAARKWIDDNAKC